MGKRGPPKKPASILKSRKTFRRDRHSDDVEVLAAANGPATVPPPPAHLDKIERAKWIETGGKLAALGLCSELDAIALEVLVRSYCGMTSAAQRLAGEELVVEVGESGVPMANPLVGIVGKQLTTLRWCLTQFGMTPSARTSIRLPEKKAVDPMAELLARKKAARR